MADKKTETNPQIKFTEEELKSLKDLQAKYQQITLALGNLAVSKINLDNRESNLKQTLADTRTEEAKLAEDLNKKYGRGSLNVDTGEFTPIEETQTSSEESK
tara:strand:+ start:258 stop:563 length:306 start_codon:yes stop_codon:yes gene_type:complete